MFREFAKIDQGVTRLPDETTIMRFRHLLERHNLAPDMLCLVNDILGAKDLLLRTGTVVDATLIAAPSSTNSADVQRDPVKHQAKKGNNWTFGMKAHIGLRASELDHGTDDEVIVYCACPNEASAALVAKQLMRAGLKRVRPLTGGIEAWMERGYALEIPVHPDV